MFFAEITEMNVKNAKTYLGTHKKTTMNPFAKHLRARSCSLVLQKGSKAKVWEDPKLASEMSLLSESICKKNRSIIKEHS